MKMNILMCIQTYNNHLVWIIVKAENYNKTTFCVSCNIAFKRVYSLFQIDSVFFY